MSSVVEDADADVDADAEEDVGAGVHAGESEMVGAGESATKSERAIEQWCQAERVRMSEDKGAPREEDSVLLMIGKGAEKTGEQAKNLQAKNLRAGSLQVEDVQTENLQAENGMQGDIPNQISSALEGNSTHPGEQTAPHPLSAQTSNPNRSLLLNPQSPAEQEYLAELNSPSNPDDKSMQARANDPQHSPDQNAQQDQNPPADAVVPSHQAGTTKPEGLPYSEHAEHPQPPQQTQHPQQAQPPQQTQHPQQAQPPQQTQHPQQAQPPQQTQHPQQAQPPQQTQHPQQAQPKFAVEPSPGFAAWFADLGASLAITTYQLGKILFFGSEANGALWSFNRDIGRCLGLGAVTDPKSSQAKGFWVTGDNQMYFFANILDSGREGPKGADAVYTPRMSYFTGDLDVHDIGVDARGRPVFVNTRFNCLARLDPHHSFAPIWKPDFISDFSPEDRCHLNGLAMREGEPAFVTAVSQSNRLDGWLGGRKDQGTVMDVRTSRIICSGLSMPHSPRWHKGRLWLLNSGCGQFGYVDEAAGQFVPITFCPGYLRGLSFIGDIAVVGLSLPRDRENFGDLALDGEIAARQLQAQCGIYFIDLSSGAVLHRLGLRGVISELYDVVALPNVRQPAAIGPQSAEVQNTLSIGPMQPLSVSAIPTRSAAGSTA